MKRKNIFTILLLSMVSVGKAGAYNCSASCEDQAKFRYACPVPLNLGRMCTSVNPATFVACEAFKTRECFDPSIQLWAEAGRRIYPMAASVMSARSRGSIMLGGCEKKALQPFYEGTVDRVRIHYNVSPLDAWAEGNIGINLSGTNSEAQTYGHDIYMSRSFKDYTPFANLSTLAHEMVHSQQFERHSSSLEEFGYNYFKKFKRDGSYESNSFEQEARNKVTNSISAIMTAYDICTTATPRPLARITWQNGASFRGADLYPANDLRHTQEYDGRTIDANDRIFAVDGNRLYYQNGRSFRSGLLVANNELRVDWSYDGRVLDANDRLFAAIGNRLYWQNGRSIRSGVLVANDDLRVDMSYDGRTIDANDRLFAADDKRFYWQNGRSFRSGVLVENDNLIVDMFYNGRRIDANDEFLGAEGRRLFWQNGGSIRSGILTVNDQLDFDVSYDGRAIDSHDRLIFTRQTDFDHN